MAQIEPYILNKRFIETSLLDSILSYVEPKRNTWFVVDFENFIANIKVWFWQMKFWTKYTKTWQLFGGFFDPDKLQEQIAELSEQSLTPDLWNDPDAARAILQKKSALERELNEFSEEEQEVFSKLWQKWQKGTETKGDVTMTKGDVHELSTFGLT